MLKVTCIGDHLLVFVEDSSCGVPATSHAFYMSLFVCLSPMLLASRLGQLITCLSRYWYWWWMLVGVEFESWRLVQKYHFLACRKPVGLCQTTPQWKDIDHVVRRLMGLQVHPGRENVS